MLIHQGWFTSIYNQDLLALQRFEFLICILLEHQMPLIRCTNLFYQGGYPVTLFPTPRRLAQSLGLGNTWVRQLQSGNCHYPTHGRIQRGGGGRRSGPQPPPPWNCHIINFCHVEIFRQTPSGNLDSAPPPPPEKIHTTAATKCNESRVKPQQTPSVEKHPRPPSVWFTTLYGQHFLASQSFKFLICILSY